MNKSFALLATALSLSCAFSSVQPPNVFPRGAVVLFQGDSITHGGRGGDMNHYLGHGYAAEIAMRYRAYRPEMGVRFFNRAVSGESSKNLLERWHRDAFPFSVTEKGYEREFGKGGETLVPDVLSLLVGINGRRSESEYHTTPEEYAANLVSLVTNALAANPRVRIVLGQPFGPNPDADLRARQQAAERVAHDYGCVFVPYQRLFDERLMKIVPNVNYWIWDGVHPTYAAHMMMADFWLETVAVASAKSL